MIRLVVAIAVLLSAIPAAATTWYVRSDGGTRYSTAKPTGQCDGQADAAYPGSGTNQHCAFNDVRYLWADGEYTTTAGFPKWGWVGQGGDTYIIDCSSDCRIGYDGPNSNNYTNGAGFAVAVAGNPYGSGSPMPPSGTPTAHTRILGRNYQNCADDTAKAHINGGYGANPVFNLSGVSYVDFACFNITDHSACTRTAQNPCKTGYPMDDYGTNGISTSNTTMDATITDVRVHGLAGNGFIGPTGDQVSLERVAIVGNALSGWNMDKADGTTGSGKLNMDHLSILWNGCAEEYPIADAVPYNYCSDDNSGGYGDGLGTATITSNPPWYVNVSNCEVAYNTQDGLDLLHLQGGGSMLAVSNCLLYGNMGQQLKVGAASASRNNLIVGNCNALRQAMPGTPAGYNAKLSDFCRAADTTVALAVIDNVNTIFQFNTLLSAQATAVQVTCGAKACTSAATITYQNNIFLGFQNNAANGYPGGGSGDYANPIYNSVPGMIGNGVSKWDHNSTYHPKSDWACPHGGESNAVCADPQLKDETWHLYGYGDMSPQPASPLIAAGIAIDGVSADYGGTARSTPPSIGAYEGQIKPPAPTFSVAVNNIGSGSADGCRNTYRQGDTFKCMLSGQENLISISGCGGTRSGNSYSGVVSGACTVTAQFLWINTGATDTRAGQGHEWLWLVIILVLILLFALLYWIYRPRKGGK